jgi:hypothetical protein
MNVKRHVDVWAGWVSNGIVVSAIFCLTHARMNDASHELDRKKWRGPRVTRRHDHGWSIYFVSVTRVVVLSTSVFLLAPPHPVRCVDLPERDPRRHLLLPEFVHCVVPALYLRLQRVLLCDSLIATAMP